MITVSMPEQEYREALKAAEHKGTLNGQATLADAGIAMIEQRPGGVVVPDTAPTVVREFFLKLGMLTRKIEASA